MAARRFRLEVDGQVIVGLAFGSEAELEGFLLGRGLELPPERAPAPSPAIEGEPRERGRPPMFDEAIEAAVHELGDALADAPDQARAILRAIALRVGDPAAVPSRKTVTRWLARRAGHNPRHNPGQNSGSAISPSAKAQSRG